MIIIQKAKPEHADELSELFFSIFDPVYKELLGFGLKKSTCKAISKLYISNADTFVAKDKKIIGFASATNSLIKLWKNPLNILIPSRSMFITPLRFRDFVNSIFLMLGVSKEYRGTGLSIRLADKVEKEVKKQGSSTIFSYIHPRNKQIIKFLSKNKWIIDSEKGIFNKILIYKKEL